VLTDSEDLARIARSFATGAGTAIAAAGRTIRAAKRFTQQFGTLSVRIRSQVCVFARGYNLKVTDMQAAIGVAQLDKLEGFIQKRKEHFSLIYEGLKPYEERIVLPEATPESDPSWFGFVITVREGAGFTRNELTGYLEQNGIETRNLFSGNITRQPAFLDVAEAQVGDLKNSDYIMNNTFFVGVYPGLDSVQIEYVLDRFGSSSGATDHADTVKLPQ